MNSVECSYLERHWKYECLSPWLNQSWAMLLDSGFTATTTRENSRYDIFVHSPSYSLSYLNANSSVHCYENNSHQQISAEQNTPLAVMRNLSKRYKTALPEGTAPQLPFQGGWLGYISYDFGKELQAGPVTVHQQAISQVDRDDLFSKNIPLIQMGFYQWALITDHQLQTTTIINFGLNSLKFTNIASELKNAIGDFSRNSNTNKQNKNTQQNGGSLDSKAIANKNYQVAPFVSNLKFDCYREKFNKVQDYIFRGDCYQVNLSQRFRSSYTGSSLAIYQQLIESNNAPFSAFLNFEQFQILSLSPERYIECRQRNLRTQPIKGTRPRSTDPIIDQKLANELTHCEKDRAENLMIVDLLRNDLSKTAVPGSVKVTELFGLYSFESVHHLISTVQSELAKDSDAFDVLETTLPGGSITGAPKLRAMQIIDQLEESPRGIYCGVIGYIDLAGNMDTNICIRTLLAADNQLFCSAGGGLVADSEVDGEYQETFDKLAKILPTLGSTLG